MLAFRLAMHLSALIRACSFLVPEDFAWKVDNGFIDNQICRSRKDSEFMCVEEQMHMLHADISCTKCSNAREGKCKG